MRPIINAFVALTLLLPALALASATPQQVVEDTSRQVMEVLDANRETYRNDVEAFTVGLNDVLEPVVDFDGIARSVMTVRYSRGASDVRQRFTKVYLRRSH